MTNKEKIEELSKCVNGVCMREINEKDYRRLEPGEIFQEGDRISVGTGYNLLFCRSSLVHFCIDKSVPHSDTLRAWRLKEKEDCLNLTPGTIIEWGGDEGFIIPNVFNYDNAIMIAWVNGPICGEWTCHADINIRQAIQEGKFKIKEDMSDD